MTVLPLVADVLVDDVESVEPPVDEESDVPEVELLPVEPVVVVPPDVEVVVAPDVPVLELLPPDVDEPDEPFAQRRVSGQATAADLIIDHQSFRSVLDVLVVKGGALGNMGLL